MGRSDGATHGVNGHAAATAWGVIVAAGRSDRMGGIDKVFTTLMGRPLVVWSLMAFQTCMDVEGVVIVAAPESVDRMRALATDWRMTKVSAVVPGGEQRQDSVRAGIDAARSSIVAVHDAARPLVTAELISRGVNIAREGGAALCATPARDTIKEAEGEPPVVRVTHDRARSWLAQTPQVFERELLLRAHANAEASATDDATLVEALGHDVRIYEGPPWNLKVTSPEDIVIAEALLRERFLV